MPDKQGPLSGVRVLDLTQFLSGPFCTMVLADMGAEVIKIERPDRPKASGPFLNGERIYDLSIMRSKKSVTLNLKAPANKAVFLELVKQADVVVENFKPGTMDKMNIGYESLCKVKPDIIYAAISGFGNSGPYRERGALDMVVQGMSGLMSLTGEADGRPLRAGTSAADVFTGLYGISAVTAALYHRERTGEGQFLDIAMLDSVFSCLENAVINTCVFNKNPERVGNRHPTSVPFTTFPTSDGDIIITCSRDAAFYKLCEAMNRPDMITDERFSKAEARRQNRDYLEAEIAKFTRTMTLEALEELLNRYEVPNGRINTMLMVCKDPQIAAREMLVEVEHPIAGKYKMPGSPIKFSCAPKTEYGPAPTLGQHTQTVLKELLHLDDRQLAEVLAEQVVPSK